MNTIRNKNIFTNTHHFTHDELIRFHHHLVTGRELHAMEKHLIDCKLCSEALTGLGEMENASLLYAVSNELHLKARRKKLWKTTIFSQIDLISIIAVAFLILFLLLMSIFFFSNVVPSATLKEKDQKDVKEK